jgi:hypothetical protein
VAEAITDAVLARAGRPFPVEPIRTLGALHLATEELLGEPPQLVTIVTRDSRFIDNARALGYVVEEFPHKPFLQRGRSPNHFVAELSTAASDTYQRGSA